MAIREVVLRKPGKAALQDPNTFPEPLFFFSLTEKRGGVTYEEERVRLTGRPKICRVSLTMPRFIHIATFRVERETYLNDNEEQYIGFSAAEREGKKSITPSAVHKPWGWATSKHAPLKAIIRSTQWICLALRTSKKD